MNGDYLDYLAHYRTPGTPNGVSHTPGYDAVGKPAMSEAERKARRKLRRSNTGRALKRAARALKREARGYKRLGKKTKKDFQKLGGSAERKLTRNANRLLKRTDRAVSIPVNVTRRAAKRALKTTRKATKKAERIAVRSLKRALRMPLII